MLFIILGILFLTLIILIPLLEKYGRERSPEEIQKITRFFVPLMIIMLIAMSIRYFMG